MCILPDEHDFWWVFGETINETGNSQEEIEVEVTFFASDGSSVAVDFGDILANVMPAEITLPFSILVESPVAPAEYELGIDGIPSETTPRDDFQIISSELTYSEDELLIVGQAHNPGSDLSSYAELTATLYDGQGTVVAVGSGFLSAGELGAGQTASFEAFVEQPHESIDSYVLVILGF